MIWRWRTNGSRTNVDSSEGWESRDGSNRSSRHRNSYLVSSIALDKVATIIGRPDHIALSVKPFNFVVDFKTTDINKWWQTGIAEVC